MTTTSDGPRVAVILPCLNEQETIADCISEALRGLAATGVTGQVICADNGSSDASARIAAEAGARVVPVLRHGYGSALMGGIMATSAPWIVIADADGSYDLTGIPDFVAHLQAGADLVQGCRLPSGGGRIEPGAMPVLHRAVGNPVLSWLVRRWFASPVRDVHCGMRAFRRDAILRLDLRCSGMEFASEMVIKAALHDLRTVQVPITLRKDRRITGTRHLRTFRDGWRHFRFMLLYSPRWLFTVPGSLLLGLGVLGYLLALPRLTLGGIHFDVGTLLAASLAVVIGQQAVMLGTLARAFARRLGLVPPRADSRSATRARHRLEANLGIAGILALLGLFLIAMAVRMWVAVEFGNLDYGISMRWLVPGTMLITLGVQLGLSNFLLSVIELQEE